MTVSPRYCTEDETPSSDSKHDPSLGLFCFRRLIGSHQQLNIPKWQHLISSFCPGVSLARSQPSSIPRLSVTLQRAPLPHYLPTPRLTNKYTVTRINKHAGMCPAILPSICSPHIFALTRLSAFQVTSCCLKSPTHVLHIAVLLLLIGLFNVTTPASS